MRFRWLDSIRRWRGEEDCASCGLTPSRDGEERKTALQVASLHQEMGRRGRLRFRWLDSIRRWVGEEDCASCGLTPSRDGEERKTALQVA